MRRSERIGSLIGAIGGLLFVLINAAGLPSPLGVVAGVLGVALFIAVDVLVVFRRRAAVPEDPPSRSQIRTYGFSVTGMVVAILVGARILDASGRVELIVVWAVFCVGAHFIPFARAFGVPVFARLGLAMMAVAVVGGVVAEVTSSDDVPFSTAVVAGFLLLGAALTPALGRRWSSPAPVDPPKGS